MRNTAKKILIVDSNDAFRESLRKFITGLGHEVFEAATGSEVIDKASSIRPDLIMMDVRLPGTNGDEVTAIKEEYVHPPYTQVINTAWSMACNVEAYPPRP
jgi:two-component system NtrC family response regulator